MNSYCGRVVVVSTNTKLHQERELSLLTAAAVWRSWNPNNEKERDSLAENRRAYSLFISLIMVVNAVAQAVVVCCDSVALNDAREGSPSYDQALPRRRRQHQLLS